MDTRAATAWFLTPRRVCGLRLRPLTLSRWLQIEALLGNDRILTDPASATMLQLWCAAQVCAAPGILITPRPLPLRSAFWQLPRHYRAWSAYLGEQITPPRYWQREATSARIRRATPWQLSTALYVAARTSTPVDDVLNNMPISQVWWWQACAAEQDTPPGKNSPVIPPDEDLATAPCSSPPPPSVITTLRALKGDIDPQTGMPIDPPPIQEP